MIKFIYSDQGEPVNDFKAGAFVDALIEKNIPETTLEINVSNEVVLTAMVLALMERKIAPEQVQLFYFHTPMTFNYFYGLDAIKGVEDIGTQLPMTDKILKLGMINIRAKHLADKEIVNNG